MADGASRLLENGYVDQDPGRAVEELTRALQEEPDDSQYYCQRAYAHILLQNYSDALLDAKKSLQLEPSSSSALLRKGMAEYHLKDYTAALETFTEGLELPDDGDAFNAWLKKCEDNLNASQPTKATAEEQRQTSSIKHDWYQTESQVAITIMVKNVDKSDVSVEFSEREFSALVRLPSGEDYSLRRFLPHNIVPEQSTFKVLTTKIEIKMKKADALRWETLEGEGETTLKHFTPDRTLKYPSSSHYTKNWDKLVVEIKEEEKTEKLEGDAALNQLFQQIYSDGSEEVKRAMNKSFMESGGTVLSTNWSDVGKRKVEVNPPEDMEWKKF